MSCCESVRDIKFVFQCQAEISLVGSSQSNADNGNPSLTITETVAVPSPGNNGQVYFLFSGGTGMCKFFENYQTVYQMV